MNAKRIHTTVGEMQFVVTGSEVTDAAGFGGEGRNCRGKKKHLKIKISPIWYFHMLRF